MDPLLSGPSTEIDKNLWTSSSRMGMITYAMYPLTVALGLKAWPFNIFATPWLTDWAYKCVQKSMCDCSLGGLVLMSARSFNSKSSYFHRWFGRIVFILSTLHVVLWTVQLFRDQDPYGKATFFVVWKYWRFQAGVAAYAAVCAMALMSLHPLRKRFYEITYYMHAALAVALLVGSALHYKCVRGRDPGGFLQRLGRTTYNGVLDTWRPIATSPSVSGAASASSDGLIGSSLTVRPSRSSSFDLPLAPAPPRSSTRSRTSV